MIRSLVRRTRAAYGPVFASLDNTLFVGASLLMGFSSGMRVLSQILVVAQVTGSLKLAAIGAASSSIGAAICAPIRGRLVDAYGASRLLAPMGVAYTCIWLVFVLVVPVAGASVIILLTFLGGAAFPPLYAVLRTAWANTYRGTPILDSGFAASSALQNVGVVLGPSVAAITSATADPRITVAAAAVLTLVCTVVVARSPLTKAVPFNRKSLRGIGSLARLDVWIMLGVTLCFGAVGGAANVLAAAIAIARSSDIYAGVLLSAVAVGAIIGAAVYGMLPTAENGAVRSFRILALLAGLVGACALVVEAPIPAMVTLMALVGGAFGCWDVLQKGLIDLVAPEGREAETFTWISSGQLAGLAFGAWVGGVLTAQAGLEMAFIAIGLVALLGALLSILLAKPTYAPEAMARP